MASYLKPRRGTYSTAASKLTSSNVLKNGEIFFELNASGAGKGMGKIKMGDGSTNYSSLPYFLSLTDCGISFTANESTDQISSLVSGVTIPNAFRYIKSSLAYLKTQVTNLNNDLNLTRVSVSLSKVTNAIGPYTYHGTGSISSGNVIKMLCAEAPDTNGAWLVYAEKVINSDTAFYAYANGSANINVYVLYSKK